MEPSATSNFIAQVGSSGLLNEQFVDGCAPGYFVVNGFWGRIGDRLEQISQSCLTPRDDMQWFLDALVQGSDGD
jgi:hypothetical protein